MLQIPTWAPYNAHLKTAVMTGSSGSSCWPPALACATSDCHTSNKPVDVSCAANDSLSGTQKKF